MTIDSNVIIARVRKHQGPPILDQQKVEPRMIFAKEVKKQELSNSWPIDETVTPKRTLQELTKPKYAK